jgi:Bacterial DNA-binding protein
MPTRSGGWRCQLRKKWRGSWKTWLEATLLDSLGTDGFTLKLGSFGKFSVRHKPGILRKIPVTGETILTKDRRKVTFISLGRQRQGEQFNL